MDTTELGAGFNPVPDEPNEVKVTGTLTITFPFEGIFPEECNWNEIFQELKDNPDNFINGRMIDFKTDDVQTEKY